MNNGGVSPHYDLLGAIASALAGSALLMAYVKRKWDRDDRRDARIERLEQCLFKVAMKSSPEVQQIVERELFPQKGGDQR